MEKLRVAIVGYGQRGSGLSETFCYFKDEVDYIAVCDKRAERAEKGAAYFEEHTGLRPAALTDYNEVLALKPDAVILTTSWADHVEYACRAMEAGVAVASEVGGAYNLGQCYKLVDTWERTRTPYMFMENCNYGHLEQLALSMKQLGLLGEIVHCEGGYCHDLRDEISEGVERRHYRLGEYSARNCENYPSHELGPIAKVLDLNRGNRPLTLCSIASKSAGLKAYAADRFPAEHITNNISYAQGDVVTTVIKCARGETITLTLDTTLPRAYSRRFTVRGTKGAIFEDTRSVFLDAAGDRQFDFDWSKRWGSVEEYYDKYDSELWQNFKKNPVGSHDGMDYLEFREFFTCLREKKPMPIDVYDAALIMAVTPLSETSIALGGQPVEFPDFTHGGWIRRYEDTEE